ncbi:UV-endonuclease UvdE [Gemmatirosa kalamazoonensis]|uniref:UV-endonuclease UvdE n=1 Tax=Gemmatirosa kalamazoonensis TaxID=861299 RepID=W0RCJ1_9BACT|nr:UV DNA damage repair endonuclease UvsE [Gemmatirosa kalamazoonensis]AHG88814.1 UV-endonuclease UvdE [Gemmatirosa kalamazoonensis]
MLRLGLCCLFVDAPIQFRTATHKHVATLGPDGGRAYLSGAARANADALRRAVERCHALGIGAFRITSGILPLATHPISGYTVASLDDGATIGRAFETVRPLARALDVRLSFHPDQFVVLNSERESVRDASARELEFQCEVAEVVGADTVTLHAGGGAGGKPAALDRLTRTIDTLSDRARARLALENDDRIFTVEDLLPICVRTGVPLVYDAHHHRCNPDALTVDEATDRAAATWAVRDAALGPHAHEPWFHISSPRDGWGAPNPRPHADYIDPADVPDAWRDLTLTVDVEAKAKERAVLDLMERLRR